MSFLVDRAASLYRVAGTNGERASVTLFILKYVASRILPRSVLSNETTLLLNGVRYHIGLSGRESFVFREIYLDHIYERLADFVSQPGWTVFDLGANIGIFSVQQALRGTRVYAFEPNPACHARLSKTITENALSSRVSLFNCAVGAGQGTAILQVGRSTLGGTIRADLLGARGSALPVRVTSLDRIVPPLGIARIDLLKMDVEGAEVDVLVGAQRTLALVNRIVLEYHSEELLEALHGILSEHGFLQLLQVETEPWLGRGNVYYARRSSAANSAEQERLAVALKEPGAR
jgi:FkbM family methyltransferase